MNGRGGRQFSRGGTIGLAVVDQHHLPPPRRRRFRGHQYVRRRTSPTNYRTGSFSDDRNDSSPPPPQQQSNRTNENVDDAGSSYTQQQPHYMQQPHRVQRSRGVRHQHESRNQLDRPFYDSHYQRPSTHQGVRSYGPLEASDNEYNDHQQGEHESHPRQQHSSSGTSTKKLDELTKSFQGQKDDIEEMKAMFTKLSTELDSVKTRVRELESTGGARTVGSGQHSTSLKDGGDSLGDLTEKDKRKKLKFLKQRERKAAKIAEKRAALQASHGESTLSQQQKILIPEQTNNVAHSEKAEEVNQNTDSIQPQAGASKYQRRTNRDRILDKRRLRKDPKDKPAKPLPKVSKNTANDDSTTQAAEPSSEERPEGDEGREGTGKERVKVFRRKKEHFNRRNQYGNRRRRQADSSERNSNDTSPQGEANGNDDYDEKRKKKEGSSNKKSFIELTESELNETTQTLKREFINSERSLKAIKETIDAKGPIIAYEFAVTILDHAICDVTSPTKLSEIANNLYQLLVSEENSAGVDFQQAFYDALNNISKREDDIAIDAPRYMDTLGQVLADCIIPMNGKFKHLIKKFLNKCIESYCPHNRAVLLASVMKGIASARDERLAKELWDLAQLDWNSYMKEGSDLKEFLESHDVNFTTQTFAPETRKAKRDSKELEKFADDVTDLVEKRCTTENLDDLVKDLNLGPDDQVDYLGTLIYAIVRGCLVTDAVNSYKLDNEALNKYSSILNAKHEEQDAIALHALTALTKLWNSYTSPRDLLRTILMELHNHGTASYSALNEWLNSASLTNIPGIGAARLSSKRYIEDLGAKEELKA